MKSRGVVNESARNLLDKFHGDIKGQDAEVTHDYIMCILMKSILMELEDHQINDLTALSSDGKHTTGYYAELCAVIAFLVTDAGETSRDMQLEIMQKVVEGIMEEAENGD